MDIERRESPRPPHDNAIAVFIPFQNRSRPDPQFLANPNRNGDLPLGCELGVGECSFLTTVMKTSPGTLPSRATANVAPRPAVSCPVRHAAWTAGHTLSWQEIVYNQ